MEANQIELELKALKSAVEENVKRSQDLITAALEEVRKEGSIHTETNKKIEELGKKGSDLGDKLSAAERRMLDLEQKLAARPAPSDGNETKSITQMIIESPEWKAAGKAGRMEPVTIGAAHLKTQIINATGQNQPLVPAARVGGIITPAERRLTIRDLCPQATTTSNLIEYASEATFTNNARPQGDTSPGGIEGERKAESAMTFTLSNAAVVTLAHWIPASRQVLADASMLQGHVEGRLMYGLKLEEEEEMLTGDGTAGTLNGLCNQATAYSRGVTNDTALDMLLKALLQVSLSNYEASAFVLNPVDWTNIMLLKDTTGRYLFTNPQDMVAPRLWAKPVVSTATMTQGKFLAGAFNLACQIWDREDATVRISENVDDHFIRNMVAILVEERLAFVVYRASALVYGNVSHAG